MKKRVLFVCIGNACRSIMAEALMKHYWKDEYQVASAGISPLGRVSDGTITVLQEAGVPVNGLSSKGIAAVDLNDFDSIVNLSEFPLLQFIPSCFGSKIINWYVPDPYGQGIESYRKARDAIELLITGKVAELMTVAE